MTSFTLPQEARKTLAFSTSEPRNCWSVACSANQRLQSRGPTLIELRLNCVRKPARRHNTGTLSYEYRTLHAAFDPLRTVAFLGSGRRKSGVRTFEVCACLTEPIFSGAIVFRGRRNAVR